MDYEANLDELIKTQLNDFSLVREQTLMGGQLGLSAIYRSKKGKLFVKRASSEYLPYLQAEALGLKALAEHSQFRVPKVYGSGSDDHHSFLAIEWIHILPHTQASLKKLGEWLGEMHLYYDKKEFGFEKNNLLGATLQPNSWTNSWLAFFKEYRLCHQLKLIEEQYQDKEVAEKGKQLEALLPFFFEDVAIKPSLLHGDLWQGNTGIDEKGDPVLFDPACYYGHHEAELSIMLMFGGFSSACFEAYHHCLPKQLGFQQRLLCYQLYHYLNHYHLFGSAYRSSCLTLFYSLLQ